MLKLREIVTLSRKVHVTPPCPSRESSHFCVRFWRSRCMVISRWKVCRGEKFDALSESFCVFRHWRMQSWQRRLWAAVRKHTGLFSVFVQIGIHAYIRWAKLWRFVKDHFYQASENLSVSEGHPNVAFFRLQEVTENNEELSFSFCCAFISHIECFFHIFCIYSDNLLCPNSLVPLKWQKKEML